MIGAIGIPDLDEAPTTGAREDVPGAEPTVKVNGLNEEAPIGADEPEADLPAA